MTKRERIVKSRIYFQKYARKWTYPTSTGWNEIAKKHGLMNSTEMRNYYLCSFDKLVVTAKYGSLNELLAWKRIPPVELYKEVLEGKRKKFPRGYWHDGAVKYRCREIGKYFFEEILKFKHEDVKKLEFSLFRKYRLDGMLTYVFDEKIYNLLEFLYPGQFKPWELPRVPRKFWDKETAIMGVLDLIKQYSIKPEEISAELLTKNGFRSVFRYFNINDLKSEIMKRIQEAEHGNKSDTLCR